MNRVAALGLCVAARLGAQDTSTGRIEGVVSGGTQARPAPAAAISAVRIVPEPELMLHARADSTGRYRFDAVPPGRYLIQLTHPVLDSLGLALPTREVAVVAGATIREEFKLPSAMELRDAVCRGPGLEPDRGVVAGRASDAADDRTIDGARVVVSWTDLVIDSTTLEVARVERAGSSPTRYRGEFRLCGVPLATRLSIHLEEGTRRSMAIEVIVYRDEGVVMRDLSLPAGASAVVTGIVRGAGGLALANADVQVRGAGRGVTTDSTGRFVFGALPDGTQLLVVRHIGYELAEIPVELRSERRLTRDVQLARAVSLDPIIVSEYRTRFREFEFNRGMHIMAEFLTMEMIARRNAEETGDLVDRIPGFTVVGHGAVARVFRTKALQQGNGCPANVVVDGVQEMGVNDVRPAQVVGIEAYASPPQPSNYRSGFCGLVVIWTTNWRRPTRSIAVPPDRATPPA